jgi:hypothetical protein
MNKLFKILSALLLVIVLVASIACTTSSTSRSGGGAAVAPMAPPAPDMSFQTANRGVAEKASAGSGVTSATGTDRKIIRTGYITMVVEKVADSIAKISALATELGGYVVSSNKNETDSGVSGTINFRIPANKYEEAFNALRKLAVKVPSENTNSQDVTQEYTDLQTNLKVREAVEAEYLALLKKAQTVEDILKVQEQLTNVRQQIEQLKGRIQYLDRSADMSIIQVSLQESKTFQDKGWNPLDTFKSALLGLVEFGKVLLNILIWLLIFCPIWIIIIVVIVLVRRKNRNKKKTV